MRRWTLATRLRVALAGLFLVLVLAGLAVVLVLREADQAVRLQSERAYPARVAASELVTSLVDQETGLRGFALTRDDSFLEPYRTGLVDEQRARQELETYLPAGDPSRVALLSVDAAITAWRDQYASLRTEFVEDGDPVATVGFGRELFDRVRSTNVALDVQLRQRIDDAERDVARARALVLVVLAGMVLALLAAIVALQRALQLSVLRPMRRLAEQVAVVSQGAHGSPIVPVGPPDLVDMGVGIESMREGLVEALGEVEHSREGIERRAAELARSNADLEQFAYVASHDLQEPLRKVASFCQLLEKRYGGQLDERGEQYIAFAVDGATRMQQLISDLLTFSRVGRTSEAFVPVDLGQVATASWNGLRARVDETGGRLHLEADPQAQVAGDPALLEMLLTNLLGNALKYHREGVAPEVRVTVQAVAGDVVLSVADNGIGIPPEYAEKVFVIFQRLHGRDEYGGTGIGLALAKKVAEFHHGSIAIVESPLGGTCLQVTLPKHADERAPTMVSTAFQMSGNERHAGV